MTTISHIKPEILRHPCNCNIISRSDNIKKGFKDKQNKEQLYFKFNDLIDNIINYKSNWCEQEQATRAITNYKGGQIWLRKK